MDNENLTPEIIVKKLRNYQLSDEDAVVAIKKLIADAVDKETGYMGATEYKNYINLCKECYRDYGYSIKGSMDDIKDIVQQAIEMCGFEKFEAIRNTTANRNKIRDMIVDNKHKFFG